MIRTSTANQINWSKYKHEYVVKDADENYIFKEQFKKLESLIKMNLKNDTICTEDEDIFNRLIGIAGERGSGKSSLLKTLKYSLEKNFEEHNYYVLPIIDPNKLDNQMGILEIILSNLYLALEKKRKVQANPSMVFNEIIRKILKQIGVVTKITIQQGDIRKNFSNEEILEQYHKRLLFEESFHDLFAEIWSVLKDKPKESYKRGYLIVLIDDIDLVNNSLVYTMLENIKKVLSVNVTTIVTYRPMQLINSIYDNKIKENEKLLNYHMIDESEIRLQTATYIEKMIMQNHLVTMPLKEEIIYLSLDQLFMGEDLKKLQNVGFNEKDSVINNIYHIIKKRTLININSLDINERTLYESSFTLRGIIQIFEFLFEDLKPIENSSNKKTLEFGVLEKNLKMIRKYFISVSDQLLDMEEREILSRWDLVDARSKNYIVYKDVYHRLMEESNLTKKEFNNNEDFKDLLAINRVEAYNVCLGDVIEIINLYKDNTGTKLSNYHFIYTVKILYSIELLSSLISEVFEHSMDGLRAKFDFVEKDSNYYFKERNADVEQSKMNVFWSTKYYNLTRYKIIPETVSWLSQKRDKLSIKYNAENDSFFDKILYTSVADEGNVKISRFKIADLNSDAYLMKQDPHRFRYRNYFLFRLNKESKLHESDELRNKEHSVVRKNNLYPFDPYSFLVKERYLAKIEEKFNYLFYSLFDVDIILTKNHDNKHGQGYSDLLKSVNEIVSKVLVSDYNLANYINRNKQENLYSEDDFEFIMHLINKEKAILSEEELIDLEFILLKYKSEEERKKTSKLRNRYFRKYAIAKLNQGTTLENKFKKSLEILKAMGEQKTTTTKYERDAMFQVITNIENNKSK